MNIISLESKFKEISGISCDMSIFPHVEIYRQVRRDEFKDKGEVFTPTSLIDKMILLSKPFPNQFNLDLCSGQGQFTIRILRYFINNFSDFNLETYLKEQHWFNEINPINVKAIFEIFGTDINIAVGDACKLSSMPTDKTGNWIKGIWYLNGKTWDRKLKKQTVLF